MCHRPVLPSRRHCRGAASLPGTTVLLLLLLPLLLLLLMPDELRLCRPASCDTARCRPAAAAVRRASAWRGRVAAAVGRVALLLM